VSKPCAKLVFGINFNPGLFFPILFLFLFYLPVRHQNKTTKITDSFSSVGFRACGHWVTGQLHLAGISRSRHELIPDSRPLLQPPRILALKLQSTVCAMNRAPALTFVSPRSMPSGGGRRGREGDREIREELGRSRGYLVTCSRKSDDSDAATDIQTGREAARERGRQAGRPHPWSASKVQVSCLAAAAAAELYSLLEAFSWTNVAAGCIQLGGEAAHASNNFA
jgi:hypothetical protein